MPSIYYPRKTSLKYAVTVPTVAFTKVKSWVEMTRDEEDIYHTYWALHSRYGTWTAWDWIGMKIG